MIYPLVFLISIVLYGIYGELRKYKIHLIDTFVKYLIIFGLSFFAGIRDLTVGTDVMYYMAPSFSYASLYSNFNSYYQQYHFEFLYTVLSYFVEKFTHNINIFLFVLMLLVLWFVLNFIDDNFEQLDGFFAFSLFILGFFNLALNYSRQMIAVAIVLYAYKYLSGKKYLKYIFFIVIATLFHISALIGLIFPILFNFNKIRKDIRGVINFGAIVIFIGILFFYNKILMLLISHGVIESKYMVHLTSGLNISFANSIFHITILLITVFIVQNSELDKKIKAFYQEMLLFDFMLIMVGFLSDTAYRIELYTFIYLTLLILPNCLRALNFDNLTQVLMKWSVVFIYAFYWFVSVVIQGIGQTYPYTTTFFNNIGF